MMKRAILFFCVIGSFFLACLPAVAQEASSPDILVNRIGYLPSSPKIALVSSPTGLPFELVAQETKAAVFSGMLQLNRANDPVAGAHLWQADFSVIEATGMYHISIPGVGNSAAFHIDDYLYDHLTNTVLKGFYYQRSGEELPKKYGAKWSRPAYHTSDALIYGATPGSGNIRPVSGGWYDGGDYGKYTVSGAFASGLLLSLYEMQPQAFGDGVIGTPGYLNNVSDLVDEMRWELEWLLRMQRDDGWVHHKVTAKEPDNPELPAKEPPRFLMPVSLTATADFCAVTAKAARLLRPLDATFAQECLSAAEKAWQAVENTPQANPFANPPDVSSKTYSDTDDWEERYWAAVELYYTTQNPHYLGAAQRLAEKRVPLLSATGYWGNVVPLAACSVLVNSTDPKRTEMEEELLNDVISLADTMVDKTLTSGLRISLKENEFTWGSNGTLLQNTIILIMAYRINEDKKYLHAALDHLHYILGRNPLSKIYVTGFGPQSPQHPYHPFSIADDVDEPVPGLLVGGPNPFLNDSVLKRSFPPNTAPALTYKDDEESFASNETSITWNAAMAFVCGWVNSAGVQ